jgi:uncharacterized protein
MRLSESEIRAVKTLALYHFGSGVQVFLFGSRTSDEKKGGDIDLFICNAEGGMLSSHEKINFMTDLLMEIGEQKIDVILDHPELRKTVFYQTIFQKGIRIC